MNIFSRFSLSALAAALILAGCGGGGGGSSDSGSNGSGTGTTTPTQGNLNSTITPSTYPAGSGEAQMYSQLNIVRQQGGFGTLTQNSATDASSRNHANYLFANYANPTYWNIGNLYEIDPAAGMMYAHTEAATKTGFTGVTPQARVVAGGLPNASAREVLAFGANSLKDGCIDSLLTSVFHRSNLLSTDVRYFGAAIVSNGTVASPYVCVIDMAYAANNGGIAPSGWVGIYPPDGQTGLALSMDPESPDPVPTAPVKGNPVSIYVNPGNVLRPSTFTLTDNLGNAVPGKILTSADFPTYLLSNEAYFVPTVALKSGTRYTATFYGTNNGASMSRTWGFTTR